jgi:2-methylaconitate cis-trans-isomerase PrpF
MNSLNTGAMFLCEAAEDSFGYVFHVHRRYSPHRLLRSFLYQGSPIIEMSCGGSTIEATIVTEGNPYVFVSGTAFNVHDAEELFNLSGATIQPLESIRTYAQRLLNLPKGSVFPKIVLLCSRDGGGIAARAVYQRSWHPSLALTGTIALAIAQNIQGTVPARLIRQNQESATDVTIETAQRLLQARVNATGSRLDDMASAVVIKNKRVFVISHSAEHYRSLPTLKLARTPNPCHEF